jgi:hypothetical protein
MLPIVLRVLENDHSDSLLFARTKAGVADEASHVIARSEIDSARFQL